MKRFLLLLLTTAISLHAAEPVTLKLWPEGAPEPAGFKSAPEIREGSKVTNVSDPTITIYRPEKPNGAAVVVAPGGGFNFLSTTSRAPKSANGSTASASLECS